MSFMYKRNKRGPKIEPCGTPHAILLLDDDTKVMMVVALLYKEIEDPLELGV